MLVFVNHELMWIASCVLLSVLSVYFIVSFIFGGEKNEMQTFVQCPVSELSQPLRNLLL